MKTWIRPAGTEPSGQRLPLFATHTLDDVAATYAQGAPTPLHHLTGLAHALGLADFVVKDETDRFGLPAFKILGVRYAMTRLLAAAPRMSDVACATAGNHGRAVARVARECGLFAHVYVPLGTPAGVIDALRRDGAHVAITSADYDETVRLMAADAAAERWTIVSDVSWPGYEATPLAIMAGYTQLMQEAAARWETAPDLVIVQAGVGSLAGAVAGWLDLTYGPRRPALVIVEPDGAACVQASLEAGRMVTLSSCGPTSMSGLRCGEVSPVAWPSLHSAVDAAVTISDAAAAEAIARLAHPVAGDPAIHAGPSGAAGVAATIALMQRDELADLRGALHVTSASRVFAIVTEGGSGAD